MTLLVIYNIRQFRRFPLLPWVIGCFVAGLLWGSFWHNLSPIHFIFVAVIGYVTAWCIHHNTTRIILIMISSFACGISLMSHNTQSLTRQNIAFSSYIASHENIKIEGRIRGFPNCPTYYQYAYKYNLLANTLLLQSKCYGTRIYLFRQNF